MCTPRSQHRKGGKRVGGVRFFNCAGDHMLNNVQSNAPTALEYRSTIYLTLIQVYLYDKTQNDCVYRRQ